MTDKLLIISACDIPFDTRPAGALYVDDGVVKLDKVKTFNAARRLLNAGANAFGVLRFASTSWTPPAAVAFDYDSPGYFDMLREYVQILHDPIQDPTTYKLGYTTNNQGAIVIIDPFLGCVETWMYDPANYDKCRDVLYRYFAAVNDLPYVKFTVGRECDSEYARAWVRDCVYPEFKAAGRVPFSYGASYCHAGSPGPMEWQKFEAEAAWDEQTALSIYRPVHNVRDDSSVSLTESTRCWTENGNPICVIWSVDGVWDGLSGTDRIVLPDGRVQARPSYGQLQQAMRYWIANAPRLTLDNGQVKYGFEYMSKAMDLNVVLPQIEAIVDVYAETWGTVPANYGKYQLDWIELEPEPQPEPQPPAPNPGKKFREWLGWASLLIVLVLLFIAIFS